MSKITILSIGILLTGGCATKQFVQEEIASSNAKITGQLTDNNTKITTQMTDSNAKINASIAQIKEKIDQLDVTLKLFQRESGELKEGIIKGLEIERDMLKSKLTHVENTLKTFKGSKDQQPVAAVNETNNDPLKKGSEGVVDTGTTGN